MKGLAAFLMLCFVVVLASCAPKSEETTSSTPSTTPAASDTAATATSQVLAKSLYDDGPRANSVAFDAAKAAAGEKLFTTKGCMACHAYGKKLTGPDLKGVTERRTELWMQHQIMEPDVMTRTDPIAHGLMVENKNLQMLKLNITQDEAQSLIHYFRKLDAGK